jgi:hypothetical protein
MERIDLMHDEDFCMLVLAGGHSVVGIVRVRRGRSREDRGARTIDCSIWTPIRHRRLLSSFGVLWRAWMRARSSGTRPGRGNHQWQTGPYTGIERTTPMMRAILVSRTGHYLRSDQ